MYQKLSVSLFVCLLHCLVVLCDCGCASVDAVGSVVLCGCIQAMFLLFFGQWLDLAGQGGRILHVRPGALREADGKHRVVARLSVGLSVYVFASGCLWLSICLWLFICCLCLPLASLSVSFCLFLSLSVLSAMYLSLSVSLCVFLSLSV